MLRVARFAAMLGFTIDEATWNALVEQSAAITRATPPRLYEEVLKLFLCGEGEKGYQFLRRSGLFNALFPGFSEWLSMESDGFPHVRIGHALDWIDQRIREGEKVSPQLLITLIFGDYLEESGEAFRRAGHPLQQSLDMAIAGFLGELARTVLIPHRAGIQVREILSYQHRFQKTPGKRPHSFISRPDFTDALIYFRFVCSDTGKGNDILRWWERFVMENKTSPAGESDGQQGTERFRPPVKQRPRKRRLKKGGGPQSP
jgi:poly(A) polymerase